MSGESEREGGRETALAVLTHIHPHTADPEG